MNRTILPLSSIKTTLERFRPVKAKVEDIAQSLLEFGQLQPIIIDEKNELVDGAHRLEASRMNGATNIWVDVQAVDVVRAREIELEANIQREDMTAVEKVKAIAEIHRLKQAKDPNWGQTQTAEYLKTEQPRVAEALKIDKMLGLFPELAAKAKDAKSIRQLSSWVQAKAANVVRVHDVKDNKIDYEAIEKKILLGDSVEKIKSVRSESFRAVITDPPFGISYDERRAGTSGSLTDYEDSPVSYERLLTMAPELFRVIQPDGFLVWFLGIDWYSQCKEAFLEAGFAVDPCPLIWDRSEGRVHTNRPDRWFAKGYDLALHCVKGDPQMIARNRSNVFRFKPVETQDREALVERPVELYAELVRSLTVPGETVADFFVGSGSCLAAAVSLGRDYFGCELSPERRAIAMNKIRAYTPEKK